MDIYTAKNVTDKLLTYVQEVADAKFTGTRLYSSSIKRFEEIADTCKEVIEIIYSIIEKELLQAESGDEFQSEPLSALQDQVNMLTREYDKLRSLIVSNSPMPAGIEYSPQDPDELIEDFESLTSKELKTIVRNYGVTLKKVAKVDSQSAPINCCADIIWKWYEARIIKKYPNAPKFNYCIYRIKGIIYSIVLAYGYYHESGKADEFVDMFEEWISKLSISPESNRWIAPFEIYEIERKFKQNKKIEPKYATITSVVLWDVLLDAGLLGLCNIEPHQDIYLRDDEIYERVSHVATEVLDPYVNYKDDSSILNSLGLV